MYRFGIGDQLFLLYSTRIRSQRYYMLSLRNNNIIISAFIHILCIHKAHGNELCHAYGFQFQLPVSEGGTASIVIVINIIIIIIDSLADIFIYTSLSSPLAISTTQWIQMPRREYRHSRPRMGRGHLRGTRRAYLPRHPALCPISHCRYGLLLSNQNIEYDGAHSICHTGISLVGECSSLSTRDVGYTVDVCTQWRCS